MILYPLGWVDFIRLSWRFEIRCIRSLTYMSKVRVARGVSEVWCPHLQLGLKKMTHPTCILHPLILTCVVCLQLRKSIITPMRVQWGEEEDYFHWFVNGKHFSIFWAKLQTYPQIIKKGGKGREEPFFLYVICGCRDHMIHLLTILLHRQELHRPWSKPKLNRFVTNKRNSRVIGGRKTH